jgi:hypothetical protein
MRTKQKETNTREIIVIHELLTSLTCLFILQIRLNICMYSLFNDPTLGSFASDRN